MRRKICLFVCWSDRQPFRMEYFFYVLTLDLLLLFKQSILRDIVSDCTFPYKHCGQIKPTEDIENRLVWTRLLNVSLPFIPVD